MSLTLLPAVDVRDGKAVRLRQGESGSETDYGSPLEPLAHGLSPVRNGFTWSILTPRLAQATTVTSCVPSSRNWATRSILKCPAVCVTMHRSMRPWKQEQPV